MQTGVFALTIIYLLSGTLSDNLALHRPTKQSSTAYGGYSKLAVDGYWNPTYGGGSCTHTDPRDHSPWWEVKLLHRAFIDAVSIQNRGELGERFANVVIRVIDELDEVPARENVCATFPGPGEAGEIYTFTCETEQMGNIVRIEKTRRGREPVTPLTLCEVAVWGPGFEIPSL